MRGTGTFQRSYFALLAVPLLALTVSCSSIVDAVRDILPSDASGGQAAELPPPTEDMQTVQSPSQTENLPVIGLSSRSTPDHIWAEPVIDGGAVSIPLPIATMSDHFHFEVPGSSGPMEFIAYQLNGLFHIRATHCPGCGGKDIDYVAGVLACPNCGATFDLETGAGLIGSKSYPSGSIPAFVYEEHVWSLLHSLSVAYERTASGEETLYLGPSVPSCGCGS
jgi:nitrite reductase/ring-hydroxylating ferredoxin subunit